MLNQLSRRFLGDTFGNIALTTAMTAPLLLGTGALAIDYALVYNQKSRLQQVADSAALNGAKELGIAGNDAEEVAAATRTFALTNYYSDPAAEAEDEELEINTTFSANMREVTVDLEFNWKPFLAHFIDTDVLPIRVTAKAGLATNTNICTLALDPSIDGSISVLGQSRLQARRCAVQSNSDSSSALLVDTSAKLIASEACSYGGYSGPSYSYEPLPVTDCPRINDPLAGRTLPSSAGACSENYLMIFRTKKTLSPGKYCGGIVILNNSEVIMQPGNYVFLNGDLDIGESASLTGHGVNLHFASDSRMIARNNSLVELSAPRNGSMAGIVLSSSPANDPDLLFEIESRDARELTGLIYLPNHTIKLGDDMDGDGKCDVSNNEYRAYHPRAHSHEHIHEDGTIHTHGHFMTGKYPWNSDGIKEHPSMTSHIHDEIVEDDPDCLANIGELSDWTAIVADTILMTSGVNLVLNADYDNSPVPVPTNDGLIGTQVRLSK